MVTFLEYLESLAKDPNSAFGYSDDNPIRDFIVGNNPTVSGEELIKLIRSMRRKIHKKPLI